MLPASNRGAGQNAGFPDACLTPTPSGAPAPVPYPNIGMNAQAVAFSQVVKISGVNALNMGSTIPMTSGDEGGTAHPSIKGPSKYTVGNPIVSIDRLPAINLSLPTTGNNMNNGLGAVAVPSAVNVTFCFAHAGSDMESLGEAMASTNVRAERLPANVAHVTIPVIAPGLATDVLRALRALGDGLAAIVLDLRGNPGGDLKAAIALAEVFVPEGAPLARVTERDGDARTLVSAGADPLREPLFVLVDRRTASAAEVLAKALQSTGRATIVGERTYGKTTVQRVIPLPSGGAVRTDVATWTSPESDAATLTPDLQLLPPLQETPDDPWLQIAWAHAVSPR